MISTRGGSPPSSTPDLPRVESSWVVSVGADTSQTVTADTTHRFPGRPGRRVRFLDLWTTSTPRTLHKVRS